jgi:hypothetical protein
VYWLPRAEGTLMSAALDGSGPRVELADVAATELAADGDDLYVLEPAAGHLHRVGGGASELVVDGRAPGAQGLIVTGGVALWISQGQLWTATLR